MNAVEVKNVSFAYKKNTVKVLQNINYSCESGSVNALLGPNGSGKTTLLKILAGLYTVQNGDVFLNGQNINDLSIQKRARIVSYVAQQTNIIDDFTVRDYLLFGKVNELRFYQTPSNKEVREVENCATHFNISSLLYKRLNEISGGERQIVAICGAVIQNAEILLLDEPTSALDLKNQNKILSILKNIARDENKTIILSTHNPNYALYLNADVALIKDGLITESGPATDIITVEKLKNIYGDDLCYSKDLSYSEISFGK